MKGSAQTGVTPVHRTLTPPVTLTMVVAVSRNGVIGRHGTLPWRQPSDLARFKAETMGRPIIMGRTTFASIGRALPGRKNIVGSRSPDTIEARDVIAVPTPAHALKVAVSGIADDPAAPRDICVIGGAQIYRAFMAPADRILLTRIDAEIAGDTFFPHLPEPVWTCVSREPIPRSQGDDYAMVLETFARTTTRQPSA